MLISDVIREAFADIVGKHKADVAFTSEVTKMLDEDASLEFPACIWGDPVPGEIRSAEVLQETYLLDIAFAEQTASDRAGIELFGARDRMEAIAKQCWRRFHDLYIAGSGEWQGQELDLLIDGPVTYQPFHDVGPRMLTGVTISVIVRSRGLVECVDAYFNG